MRRMAAALRDGGAEAGALPVLLRPSLEVDEVLLEVGDVQLMKWWLVVLFGVPCEVC